MKSKHVKKDSGSLKVILGQGLSKNPPCKHGPSILFERSSTSKTSTRFFACSAFRDRKQCSLYIPITKGSAFNEKQTEYEGVKLKTCVEYIKNPQGFCSTCEKLIKDLKSHANHSIITGPMLEQPSKLLPKMDNAKSQAQFHFSETTLKVIEDIILKQNPSLLVCLGTPSIFERLKLNKVLLDIDARYAQFHEKFCHYNMFNHHFFDLKSQNIYQKEQNKSHKSVLVVTDPPFGGRPELIGNSLKLIKEDFGSLDFHVIWIFPYYMESQILPLGYEMSDFQVCYSQESNYRQGHQDCSRRKLGSPVRIFTDLPLKSIDLSILQDQYRLCETCQKYVCLTNKHCHDCGSCTGKNGGLYKHCHDCQRCVKISWRHCNQCKKCTLKDHQCTSE